MKDSPLTTEYTFAGFDFPRYIVTEPKGPRAYKKRIDAPCGSYQTNPGIAPSDSHFFYLGSDFEPSLRIYQLSTGWYYNDAYETIHGIVARLPHDRGFLAGWTMGDGMASNLDRYVYDDQRDAERAANDAAQQAAERQQEFEAEQEQELTAE